MAEVVYKVLLERGLLSAEKKLGAFSCYVTDLPMRFEKLGNIFFGSDITNVEMIDDF